MSEAPAMKITILTIFPEMFESVLNSSILGLSLIHISEPTRRS